MEKSQNQLLEEFVSYLYGIIVLLGLACVMLVFHIVLDFFFHN